MTRQNIKSAAPVQALFSEVFSDQPVDGACTDFVLSHLTADRTSVLWIQDRLTTREVGRPYQVPFSSGLLHMELSHPRDVLIAVEEGLRCSALSAVVVEIWGDPTVLDFTASRRLALRSDASGTACWMIRRGAAPGLSAARDRWRVSSLPSRLHPDDPAAPGDPCWKVELFRSRTRKPGTWVMYRDRATGRVDLPAPFRDGAVAGSDAEIGRRATR